MERATTVTDDAGQPGVPTWAVVAAAVPIWTWVGSEAETVGGGRTVVGTQLWGILPRGTDVTEGDRLTNVVDRRAVSVLAGVINIEAVIDRHDHKQLALRAIA